MGRIRVLACRMRLFRRADESAGAWSLEGVARPWSGASLYARIGGDLDEGGRLRPEAGDLVGEAETPGGLRFAAGAFDGIFGGQPDGKEQKREARVVQDALTRLVDRSDAERLRALYDGLVGGSTLGVVDRALDAVRVSPDRVPRLAEIGRVLAHESPDKEAVKFGIAIVGRTGALDVDQPMLVAVGAHDEFTLFAAVALTNLGADQRALWSLAQRVTGWGRIHAVRRLTDTTDPEIRAWMLRDGFHNDVMDEYLAYTCATTGHLADALAPADIDDALFRGASGILSALASGGPAEDLSDYGDADRALGAWLRHAERRPISMEVVTALDQLARAPSLAPALSERIEALRASPPTFAVITEGLASPDPRAFAVAHVAARRRGIDDKERLFAFAATGDTYAAYELFQIVDDADIDRALEMVRGRIDLEAVASGPGLELGIGPVSDGSSDLEDALGGLDRFPGRGVDLVLAGLRSPVIRVRHGALRVLQAWGPEQRSSEVTAALTTARQIEPDGDVRRHMDQTLAGKRSD
jgi:hypothetical protein